MGTMRVPLKQGQTAKNELFSKLEGSFCKHDFYILNSCRRMFFRYVNIENILLRTLTMFPLSSRMLLGLVI